MVGPNNSIKSTQPDQDGCEHLREVHKYQVFITAMCVVMVIRKLGKNCIQTNRDKLDVLRHIIKNVSERLVQLIESRLQSRKGFFCQ